MFAGAALLFVLSGCWKGPLPGSGDHPGVFTCTDDSGDGSGVRPTDIAYLGTWDWLESCGGIAYMCSTPESAGYDERLHLSPRGSYIMCRDEETAEEGRYLIEQRDDRNLVHFVNRDLDTLRSLFLHQVSADTLVLDEGCCDRFAHLYARD
ncbi:MAG: hypothetical protein HKN17_10235 [Rhodothermales bacterium]|nr:hypothetical protein [Rhodothermales bacterium]